MDPAVVAPLHGLFAFSGGVQSYVAAAEAAGLQVLSQSSGVDGFYRTQNRKAPHNVYATPQALLAHADAAHQAAPAAKSASPAPGRQASAVAAGTPTAD